MSAEQRDEIKRLADELVSSGVLLAKVLDDDFDFRVANQQDRHNKLRARLHAAIDAAFPGVQSLTDEQIDRLWCQFQACDDGPSCLPDHRGFARALLAHTAEPLINAAPARQFDLRPDREIVAEQARKREPEQWAERAAPNEPVAPLPSADWSPESHLGALQDSVHEQGPVRAAERASPQAVPAAPIKEDLAVLVRKLAYSLRKASPEHTLPNQAIEYLRRHDLQGSPLRISPAGPCALCHTNETGYVCTGRCEEHAAPQAVDAPVAPFAWYSARIDDCITDAKKRSRAKVQPWDAEHFDQPLYALKAPAKESEGSADV